MHACMHANSAWLIPFDLRCRLAMLFGHYIMIMMMIAHDGAWGMLEQNIDNNRQQHGDKQHPHQK